MPHDTYKDPEEGFTYVSPQMTDSFDGNKYRLITGAIDQTDEYSFIKIKKEVVLRVTPGGKNVIKATVYENPRKINVLHIQEYTPSTGSPHKKSFCFVGEEIPKLFRFIKNTLVMYFESKTYQRLSNDDIEKMEITSEKAMHLFDQNKEMFQNIMRHGITNEDVIAVGYRKKQLKVFNDLLFDESYFEKIKTQKECKNESLWQQFFEKNQWIFGYGLGYIFLTGLDDKKLEQVVQGYDVNTNGKRVDALMKTRGLISNLCFVEIKTHITKLLDDTAYRSGCFAPSKELSGAIAQVQGTVSEAIKNLSHIISISDNLGNPTGEEVYNYLPKSFLVIGSLSEFDTEHGVNIEKLRSFELFRKNIFHPEIITFDELYERAKFITRIIDK